MSAAPNHTEHHVPIGVGLLAAAKAAPGHPAVVSAQGTVSFAVFAAEVRETAGALVRSGLSEGRRFVVISRNSPMMLELMFAASMVGAVLVPVNVRLSPREVADIVADSEAGLVFVEQDLRGQLEHLDPSIRSIRIAADLASDEYRSWRRGGSDALSGAPDGGRAADEPVIQMYTTGTTGRAKGALLSQANLSAMASSVRGAFRLTASTRYLALLPMFHISGAGTPMSVLLAGGTVVMSSGADASAIVGDIARHRVTHANLVPSVIATLVSAPDGVSSSGSSLQMLMYGAAPSGSAVIAKAMELMPDCGFVHGYGLTECTGGVSYTEVRRSGTGPAPGTCVGTAAPGIELRIVDPVTLVDVPRGFAGEVWVRGAQTSPGYWNRREETEALYFEPGWLRTGDIGLLEGEQLYLKDRLKDMIISGGENVYSAEVEEIVGQHPAVVEVAVVGVPDERWGEVVKAVVMLEPGASTTAAEIIEFTRGRLAHFKCPKYVDLVQSFPRTGNGKILKRALRGHPHAGG